MRQILFIIAAAALGVAFADQEAKKSDGLLRDALFAEEVNSRITQRLCKRM